MEGRLPETTPAGKATPGPWDTDGGRANVVYAADGTMVADVSSSGSGELDGDRRDANAKLIAASPCLLAVCERLVNDDDIAQGFGGLSAHLDKLRDMARAAIAKATGGAS